MATFKIMKPCATFAGVKYNEGKRKENKGEKIHFENFGWLEHKENLTETDIKNYLEKWSSFNPRVKNKQFHAVISAKGRTESFDELKKKALRIMDKLGYSGNPILMYSHSDTKNNHIHIVTSRVRADGNKINDSFEKERSLTALLEVEKRNLSEEFTKISERFLDYNFSNYNQFNILLEEKGYKPKICSYFIEYWKMNKIQGKIAIADLDNRIKAVDSVKTKARAKQIETIVKKYQKKFGTELVNINPENSSAKPKLTSELINYLKEKHALEFIFFTNTKYKEPYAYMVIDHKTKSVFKGSEIISLKNLVNPKNEHEHKASSGRNKVDLGDQSTLALSSKEQKDNTGDIETQLASIINEGMKDNDQGKRGTKTFDDLPVKRRRNIKR